MINLLQGITTAQLRDRLLVQINSIATRYQGTKLGIACIALSDFVKKYATMTPARIGFQYAFSNLEQEAAALAMQIYLGIVEIRSSNTRITTADQKNIERLILQILKRAPGVAYDFKTFSTKYPDPAADEDKEIARYNIIIEEYFKCFKDSLPNTTDPLVLDCIKTLENHKLLYRDGAVYNYDQLTAMFLYIMLKFDAMINIHDTLNTAIIDGAPDLGQFKKQLTELANEIWPTTKRDAIAAVNPITRMGLQIMLRGDPSIIQDIIYIFTKCEVDISVVLQLELKDLLTDQAADKPTASLKPSVIAATMQSMVAIQQPAMRQMLLLSLDKVLIEQIQALQENQVDTSNIYAEISKSLLALDGKSKAAAEIYLNTLRHRLEINNVISFSSGSESEAMPNRKRSRMVRQVTP